MKIKKLAVFTAAAVVTLTASAAAGCGGRESDMEETEAEEEFSDYELPESAISLSDEQSETEEEEESPEQTAAEGVQAVSKTAAAVKYISVTGDGVNIRSGAGTSYSSLGSAEADTLYICDGETGGWYRTRYRGMTAYISAKYCVLTEIAGSGSEQIESVIAVGESLLGTPYVYGAVRVHDGNGNLYKAFTTEEFDCSSLMQYMFYKGAGVLIDVNTRTQVLQGTTVSRSELKRGDLMFFTNSSRVNRTGIERIGHVGMYLGGGYILHTASDYAKIEKISSQRWAYYIQAQRII